MLLEGFLSFLGLGIQPPMSSWGTLIKDGVESMEEYSWLLIYPGITFTITLFALLIPPAFLSKHLQRLTERSATPYKYRNIYKVTVSANGLSPVTSSSRKVLIRTVSCYAIFKGWLLLSQPPGCFGRPTCFPT